jgi:hypothetical protein
MTLASSGRGGDADVTTAERGAGQIDVRVYSGPARAFRRHFNLTRGRDTADAVPEVPRGRASTLWLAALAQGDELPRHVERVEG